jgi:hypothetical protein
MLGIFDIEELCEKKYVSWDGKYGYETGYKFRVTVWDYNRMRAATVELYDDMSLETAKAILQLYGVDYGQPD